REQEHVARGRTGGGASGGKSHISDEAGGEKRRAFPALGAAVDDSTLQAVRLHPRPDGVGEERCDFLRALAKTRQGANGPAADVRERLGVSRRRERTGIDLVGKFVGPDGGRHRRVTSRSRVEGRATAPRPHYSRRRITRLRVTSDRSAILS